MPMKELVVLLEGRGFENIRTYIQSGNIVLQSKHKPASNVSADIFNQFGFSPDIVVLNKSEFLSSASRNPFQEAEGNEVYFYFSLKKPELNVTRIDALITPKEKYAVKGNVFYLYAPDGIGRSKLAANIDSCLGGSATGRNLNTVRKLKKLLEDG